MEPPTTFISMTTPAKMTYTYTNTERVKLTSDGVEGVKGNDARVCESNNVTDTSKSKRPELRDKADQVA